MPFEVGLGEGVEGFNGADAVNLGELAIIRRLWIIELG